MGRRLTHLKTPVQQVPGMRVELSRSLPICEQAAWVWNVGWGGCGCVLGCEASGQSRAGWPLGRLTIAPTTPLRLAGGGVRGLLYGATGSDAGDPWFPVQRWFQWIPWGLQLANSSPVKECCGVFYIVFVLITKNKTPSVLAQGKVGAAGDWETWSCFLER